MTEFAKQVEAVRGLVSVRTGLASDVAAAEAGHRAALKVADELEWARAADAEAATAAVEQTLVRAREALAGVGLENAVPRKVRARPGGGRVSEGDAHTDLGKALADLDAAVRGLLAHRDAEKAQRRRAFVEEESRRAEAERARRAEALRRKEEAQARAAAAAEARARRQKLMIAAVVGFAILIVLVLLLLS